MSSPSEGWWAQYKAWRKHNPKKAALIEGSLGVTAGLVLLYFTTRRVEAALPSALKLPSEPHNDVIPPYPTLARPTFEYTEATDYSTPDKRYDIRTGLIIDDINNNIRNLQAGYRDQAELDRALRDIECSGAKLDARIERRPADYPAPTYTLPPQTFDIAPASHEENVQAWHRGVEQRRQWEYINQQSQWTQPFARSDIINAAARGIVAGSAIDTAGRLLYHTIVSGTPPAVAAAPPPATPIIHPRQPIAIKRLPPVTLPKSPVLLPPPTIIGPALVPTRVLKQKPVVRPAIAQKPPPIKAATATRHTHRRTPSKRIGTPTNTRTRRANKHTKR